LHKKFPIIFCVLSIAFIFATRYANEETYKTHKENIPDGGLQRSVCNHIKA
jgi:hypothetical protein